MRKSEHAQKLTIPKVILLLREGLKKHVFFVDKRPPPLNHIGGFYDKIIKFDYYHHQLPPLPPTFIHISIVLKHFLKLFFIDISKKNSSVLGRNKSNTTKYALKCQNSH